MPHPLICITNKCYSTHLNGSACVAASLRGLSISCNTLAENGVGGLVVVSSQSGILLSVRRRSVSKYPT